MGNADNSPIPRGSLEFVQMKCDKGSLEHPSLAPCSRISSQRWVVGRACGCTSGPLQMLLSRKEESQREVIVAQPSAARLLLRAWALRFPLVSALKIVTWF